MNARQKLHQVHLQEWTVRFADQKASGLTVRQWCEQNNLSFHTYNYWKHLLKEEVVDQVLPDIVPLSLPVLSDSGSSLETTAPAYSFHSCDDRSNNSNVKMRDKRCFYRNRYICFRRVPRSNSSGRCAMLKDADHSYFAGVYIVCGYTDLRFGIDSLAAIIERRFHMHLFVPNTLFLFCGRSSTKIKGLLWEGDGFLLLYKRVESGHFTWPRSSNRSQFFIRRAVPLADAGICH